jgi:hypothetical protein
MENFIDSALFERSQVSGRNVRGPFERFLDW